MNCKNCGTRLSDKAKVCPNCGAFVDDSSGYTLLAADDRYYDVYSSEKKEKKNSPFKNFLILLLVVLVAGGGTFLFFDKIQPALNKPPELGFNQGSGIINRNEKVVYVLLDSKSNIEYIHGVSLYNYDRTKLDDIRKSVSDDYEYTKNIDSTFRAIFFDLKDYNIVKGEKYVYTFEMQFSFKGSDKIYTYYDAVSFDGDISEDASDIVFDHSLNEGSSSKKADKNEEEPDYSFIYNGFWYSSPLTKDSERSISAYKFNKNMNYTVTQYVKKGDADWTVSDKNGTFKIKNGELILSRGGTFTLDADNEEIVDKSDSQAMTSRKYNSLKNTEDFFGL